MVSKAYKMEVNLRPSILVPTDFSDKTVRALVYAADLARSRNSAVFLLHVYDTPDKALAEEEKALMHKLEQICIERSASLGVAIKPIVVHGDIFHAIPHAAQSLGADLIVMAMHDRNGMQRIIGSYAHRVIKDSSVPVLILRKNQRFTQFQQILLPLNVFKPVQAHVSAAIEIASQHQSTVHLVSLLAGRNQLSRWFADLRLWHIARYLRRIGIHCSKQTLKSAELNIDLILDYGNERQVDLVLMMTRNSRKDTYVGSTAAYMMDYSDVPVLLITPAVVQSAKHKNLFFDPLSLIL